MKLTTPACFHCGKTSEVEVTEQESLNLRLNLKIQDALPDRDANFRELVKSGIHPACWDAIFS